MPVLPNISTSINPTHRLLGLVELMMRYSRQRAVGVDSQRVSAAISGHLRALDGTEHDPALDAYLDDWIAQWEDLEKRQGVARQRASKQSLFALLANMEGVAA